MIMLVDSKALVNLSRITFMQKHLICSNIKMYQILYVHSLWLGSCLLATLTEAVLENNNPRTYIFICWNKNVAYICYGLQFDLVHVETNDAMLVSNFNSGCDDNHHIHVYAVIVWWPEWSWKQKLASRLVLENFSVKVFPAIPSLRGTNFGMTKLLLYNTVDKISLEEQICCSIHVHWYHSLWETGWYFIV